MDTKLRKSQIIVHLFALAHAGTVYLLHYFALSDELTLSLLTISMVVIVSQIYGFPLEVSAALAALCCFAGFYMGTIGGETLAKVNSEFVSGFANEITTFAVTEILGWTTILISVKINRVRTK
ncbi:MAG: hypothetical protein SOZ00_06950 [Tidjanibacter sp.]|nr:hypothetical protein [Tidjanibacter sp.]